MCTKLILRAAVPLPKLTEYNNYVFVGPHPDDIEIGAGATAAKLVRLGKNVTFLICTDGRYGTPDGSFDFDELARIRQGEAIAAAKHLGVTDVSFLPFPDGGDYTVKDMAAAIARVICEKKAEVVFAADPKVISEMHIDHLQSGEAATLAILRAGTAGIMHAEGYTATAVKAMAYYYTDKPNRYVSVGDCHKTKLEAIRLHKSQFNEDTPDKAMEMKGVFFYLNFRAIRFGMRRFTHYAEGFRAYSSVHFHCAPEAATL